MSFSPLCPGLSLYFLSVHGNCEFGIIGASHTDMAHAFMCVQYRKHREHCFMLDFFVSMQECSTSGFCQLNDSDVLLMFVNTKTVVSLYM